MGKKVKIGKIKVKEKCCVSKKRCSSCPIRLLKEGRLPDGYAVHKRKLVTAKAKERLRAMAARLPDAIHVSCVAMTATRCSAASSIRCAK